jgi:hypothetical protein
LIGSGIHGHPGEAVAVEVLVEPQIVVVTHQTVERVGLRSRNRRHRFGGVLGVAWLDLDGGEISNFFFDTLTLLN